jgi:hypothetical protein
MLELLGAIGMFLVAYVVGCVVLFILLYITMGPTVWSNVRLPPKAETKKKGPDPEV